MLVASQVSLIFNEGSKSITITPWNSGKWILGGQCFSDAAICSKLLL